MTTLTLAEAAARLGVSRTAVVKMINTGKLRAWKEDIHYHIIREEVRRVYMVDEQQIERIRRER